MRRAGSLIVMPLSLCLLLSPAFAVAIYDRWPMGVCLSVVACLMGVMFLANKLGGLSAFDPSVGGEKGLRKPEQRKFIVEELQTMQESAKIVQGEPYLLRSRGIVKHCLHFKSEGRVGTPAIELICHESSFLDDRTRAPKAPDEILDLLLRLLYDVETRPYPATVSLVDPQSLVKALAEYYIVLYLSRKRLPFHFAVIDDEHVYLEDYHLRRNPSRVFYFRHEPFLSKMYTEEFLKLLDKVEDDRPLVSRIPFERIEPAKLVSMSNGALEAYRCATGER